jgi:hypothetical protein
VGADEPHGHEKVRGRGSGTDGRPALTVVACCRCKKLYAKALLLEPSGEVRVLPANERMFNDFFVLKRQIVTERAKGFKPPGATSYDSKKGGGEEIRTMVRFARAGMRLVITVWEKLGEQKRVMPDVIIHEDELSEVTKAAFEAELKSGIPESVVRNKDRYALVADFLLRKMTLVSRILRGQALPVGEKVMVLPTLTRCVHPSRSILLVLAIRVVLPVHATEHETS